MPARTTAPPVPAELLKARTVLDYTIETLRNLERWVHEVERLEPGRYGELIDHLKVAGMANESGTPAALLDAVVAAMEGWAMTQLMEQANETRAPDRGISSERDRS